VKAPVAPELEKRRSADFLAELRKRARAWIPGWDLSPGQGDFGQALLDVAARFNSEIAERLDHAGDKMRGGFLDWLGMRGKAARPARVPVVFKLNDSATASVNALAPIRLQASAGATPVVFETEESLTIIPAKLQMIVAADPDRDAYFLPPPDLSSLEVIQQFPTQWKVTTFAPANATTLQLMPGVGLLSGMLIKLNGHQYTIQTADKDLITIDRPLEAAAEEGAEVDKVTSFAFFDSTAANQQQHFLYIGDADLLNVTASVTIGVENAAKLADKTWQYWGKLAGSDTVDWQKLTPSTSEDQPGVLLLQKPAGSMEQLEIAGRNSRWIRASADTVIEDPFGATHLAIKINPSKSDSGQCLPPDGIPSIQADAMANTTPLVTENVFFPLGKEPKQFEAFYVGSQEVFSKKGATAQLRFEMTNPNFAALSVLPNGPLPNRALAGVAADGHLHLLTFDPATAKLTRYRDPLQPPAPASAGLTSTGPAVLLVETDFRLPMWISGSNMFVAAVAANAVWLWREDLTLSTNSGWIPLGTVGGVADPNKPIDGLVFLGDGGQGQLLALRDGKLYIRNLNVDNSVFTPVEVAPAISVTRIAPIGLETDLGGHFNEGIVSVAADGKAYGVTFAGVPLTGTATKFLDHVAPDIVPAAVRRADSRLVAVAMGENQAGRKILGFRSQPGTFINDAFDDATLDAPEIVGHCLGVNVTGSEITFVTCLEIDSLTRAIAAWSPAFGPDKTVLFTTEIPVGAGVISGPPALLPQYILIPTSASDVLVAPFDLSRRLALVAPLGTTIVTTATNRLLPGDAIAFPIDAAGGTIFDLQTIATNGVDYVGSVFYDFAEIAVDDKVAVFRAGSPTLTGSINNPNALNKMTIDPGDVASGNGSVLMITTDAPPAQAYLVTGFNPATGVATLDRDLAVADPMNPPANVEYKTADTTVHAAARSRLKLDSATTGNWNAGVLSRSKLVFPGADPRLQVGQPIVVDANQHPQFVALTKFWTTAPQVSSGTVQFLVDLSVGDWISQLGDTSSNPDLSWEYWNGKGWWRLNVTLDETLSFKHSGVVRFIVPDDLASSDWAGKTNYWIRARLVGGDYGQEKVTVTTKDLGNGKSEQTVERSTDGIRVPSVLKLQIAYALCKGVLPEFILTKDSGSIRDQSNANRSGTANVEAFVPLAETLRRLLQVEGATATAASAEPISAPCDCPGGMTTVPTTAPAPGAPPTTSSTASGTSSSGPCLFIGIDGTIGDTDNVHLLVLTAAEHDYTSFAPLKVQAIVANRFTPVVASDGTRALGESGLIEMSFAVAPAKTDLFGQSLIWLRLLPGGMATTQTWQPALGGIYLNAVYAKSTETLTRELLGSADGSPNLTVTLARPPVLDGTLELRVCEPLGEEELEALKDKDPNLVVTEGSDYWVLWKQVDDTADQPAGERVYSLDESTGEIQFGDGAHGMIPPIGRDSIVAFSYQRTEPPTPGSDAVPANGIPGRTTLNLVSPVETVESVTTAADSAGGSAPENNKTVLEFGYARLRHRDRALTLEDFEDLALESSPSIAQAHAFSLPRGRVQIILVMRGNPLPTLSQIRELRRNLLSQAPAALALPEALTVSGPTLRKLRIKLILEVESLDKAADLSVEVKVRLTALFDTLTGNLSGDGWPLGLTPAEDVVAAKISDAPGLASTTSITFFEVDAKDNELSWPAQIKATDLVVLADDPVRIEFQTQEALL
jgi:hypothetical protein